MFMTDKWMKIQVRKIISAVCCKYLRNMLF
jgi:hypothetical protein